MCLKNIQKPQMVLSAELVILICLGTLLLQELQLLSIAFCMWFKILVVTQKVLHNSRPAEGATFSYILLPIQLDKIGPIPVEEFRVNLDKGIWDELSENCVMEK